MIPKINPQESLLRRLTRADLQTTQYPWNPSKRARDGFDNDTLLHTHDRCKNHAKTCYNTPGDRTVSISNPKQMTPTMRRPSKRPRKPRAVVSPASLPLPDQEGHGSVPSLEASPEGVKKSKSWTWGKPIKRGGIQHRKAMEVAGMKMKGLDNAVIAKAMNTTPGTVSQLLYRANQAGLIDFGSAKEEVEGKLWPKAVRNMDGMLDSRDPEQMERATFKTMDMMTKAFYADKGGDPAQMVTMIGIKVESVPNASPVRAEMIGGIPAYQEGEAD